MIRRAFILSVMATSVVPLRASAQSRFSRIEVFKTPTCGCCSAWVDHLLDAGFDLDAQDVDQDALWALKERSRITPELSSCHTAIVDGYFIEGHVPASDVRRLLSEKPDALGLTVPGMPIGSPGMEMGEQRDPFETFLVLRTGTTEVYQRH